MIGTLGSTRDIGVGDIAPQEYEEGALANFEMACAWVSDSQS